MAPGSKEPIVLGNVGTFSGPVGAAFAGTVTGVKAWAKFINDRGGIDGHPVVVISVDDGADPARSKANVQDLIEHRGAVALIGDYSVITRGAHSEYLSQKRVPVVGGEGATREWRTNPMYFLNGAHTRVMFYGSVQEAAKTGKKDLAIFYCAEVPACEENVAHAREGADDARMNVVYTAKISLAQPDYTSECLQAKSRNAEAIWVMGDPNTLQRVTQSCSRQGFKPLYVNAHSTQDQGIAKYSGLEGGLVGTQPQVPWFVESGTPGVAEYAAALRRYAPTAKRGQDVVIGWTSGKLFEAAISKLGPTPTKLSSADVLRGLWQITDETLDGMSVPLTFVKGNPSPWGRCWFADAVKDGKWVAPNGTTPTCIDKVFK